MLSDNTFKLLFKAKATQIKTIENCITVQLLQSNSSKSSLVKSTGLRRHVVKRESPECPSLFYGGLVEEDFHLCCSFLFLMTDLTARH